MKFSIIVPAYKPQFLAECIESILAQTYQDWELILVNDASPHDLDTIVNKYSDSRIRYYKRKKGFGAKRLVDNWNDCLKNATGEYVINMGDDDRLCPNCLQDYVSLITNYPGKNLYHTRVEYINEKSEVTKTQKERPEVESVYGMMWRKLKRERICIGEFLFERNSLMQRDGYFNLPFAWGSDDMSSYEAAKAYGVANCNNPGFQYRDNTYSISSNEKVILEKYSVTLKWEEWFNQFLLTVPESEENRRLYKQIVDNYKHVIIVTRQSYIDLDIRQRYFRGFLYWLKRIQKDKSAAIKNRTLLVFLYYAIRNTCRIECKNDYK